jgi:transitional endoplasmic reticulum ATPase
MKDLPLNRGRSVTLTTIAPDFSKIRANPTDPRFRGFEISYLERCRSGYFIKRTPPLKENPVSMNKAIPTNNGKKTTKEEEKEIPRRPSFEYKGDKLIIPENMSLDEVRDAVDAQIEEDSVQVTINEPVNAFPLDGAVALWTVLQRKFGWTHLKPTETMWGSYPPTMLGVEIDFERRIQVPWGHIEVPNIEGRFSTGCAWVDGIAKFTISGTVPRKSERLIAAIAEEVRQEVKTNSIYRGKAVKINFRDSDGDRKEFDFNLCPKFMDMSGADNPPIFSKSIDTAIQSGILNLIRYSKRCRNKGASLKKGFVLGGPYGTGKTLTAYWIARECIKNGWTFLYLEDVRDLDLAIGFAKNYGPCCLFAEDIDRATSSGRTPEMDRLLNTLDGVESKGNDALVVVLTTNHLNAINPAFLRPGRIDTVIEVTPPDPEACVRIIKKYVAEGDCVLEGTDEDIQKAIAPLIGANAAFFRSAIEMCKVAAVEHMTEDDGPLVITIQHLTNVARSLEAHCKLINPEHGTKPLSELEGVECDPVQMAMEILMNKFANGFIDNITNPKVLKSMVKKVAKGKSPMGNDFSSN